MTFPHSERVVFENRPLREVICQLRFPPILRIEAEQPHVLQDKIRDDYPNFEKQIQTPAIPVEIASLFGAMVGMPLSTSYSFSDESKVWTASIAKDFIAISATGGAYTEWKEFRRRLSSLVEVFCEIYRPSNFVRVGLRYINEIRRESCGLSGVRWSELLRPSVVGELAEEELKEENFELSQQDIVYVLNEGDGKARIKHGLFKDNDEKSQAYRIDTDLFSEGKLTREEAYVRLERYNLEAGNLFRWYIQPRLADALVPKKSV